MKQIVNKEAINRLDKHIHSQFGIKGGSRLSTDGVILIVPQEMFDFFKSMLGQDLNYDYFSSTFTYSGAEFELVRQLTLNGLSGDDIENQELCQNLLKEGKLNPPVLIPDDILLSWKEDMEYPTNLIIGGINGARIYYEVEPPQPVDPYYVVSPSTSSISNLDLTGKNYLVIEDSEDELQLTEISNSGDLKAIYIGRKVPSQIFNSRSIKQVVIGQYGTFNQPGQTYNWDIIFTSSTVSNFQYSCPASIATSGDNFGHGNGSIVNIYVPDDAVDYYKALITQRTSYIHPISEYQGEILTPDD